MLLDLRVVGQGIQTIQFGLIGLGTQRLTVDRDQAGDVAIGGFDDVFGGVVLIVLFAQKIAERVMAAGGVQTMLHGAAHQGGGIDGLLRLGGGEAHRRKRQGRMTARGRGVRAGHQGLLTAY